MTEYLADTARVARIWCPMCDPDADPTREILDTRYCGYNGHDPHAPIGAYVTTGEAGGEDNRVWCDFFHRGKVRPI